MLDGRLQAQKWKKEQQWKFADQASRIEEIRPTRRGQTISFVAIVASALATMLNLLEQFAISVDPKKVNETGNRLPGFTGISGGQFGASTMWTAAGFGHCKASRSRSTRTLKRCCVHGFPWFFEKSTGSANVLA